MAVESAANIRASTEFQGAKRERSEAEARAKADAEMKENAYKTGKLREEKAKVEAETVERARVWDNAKAK